MELKKAPLSLDLIDRYSDSHAVIHATGDHITGTHWAVAQVVVRMDGEKEDSPRLVKFAHELVNRYNQHNELTEQRDELLDVLELAVEQMESDSIQIESEWGCGRDIDELDKAGELPEAILKTRAFIAKAKGGAVNHSPDIAEMVAPEGWQLVPVEPTIEMVQAATHSAVGFGTRAAYQAMLAAAPKHEGGAA